MPKIKLEKITGAVALSYLVLIPAGAFYVWRRIEAMDHDISTLWNSQGNIAHSRESVVGKIRKGFNA